MDQCKICFIVGRNLGDALIQSIFVKNIAKQFPSLDFIVWCRLESAIFFENANNITVVTSAFPIGTSKRLNFITTIDFIKKIFYLRKFNIGLSADFFGDCREFILARFIGSTTHLCPDLSEINSFKALIRSSKFVKSKNSISVKETEENIYKVYDLFKTRVLDYLSKIYVPAVSIEQPVVNASKRYNSKNSISIGIHPFASQKCKLWEMHKWESLIRKILNLDSRISITVFCSPAEKKLLDSKGPYSIIASGLDEFLANLATQDLFICLDSLSSHAANLVNVESLILYGSVIPSVWLPPKAIAVCGSPTCGSWPCFNKPKCKNLSYQFSCMRSIEVSQVLELVKSKLGLINHG